VAVDGQAGHVAEAGGERRVPGDHAAALQALGEDHVVDPLGVEALGGSADHVISEVERAGVTQRTAERGTDRGPQRGHDDSFGHRTGLQVVSRGECYSPMQE